MRKRVVRDKQTKKLKVAQDIIEDIPKNERDRFVNVNEFITLDRLAQQFYGDPSKWRIIANANGLTSIVPKNKLRLRIPSVDSFNYIRD